MRLFSILLFNTLILISSAFAGEPTFTVKSNSGERTYTRAELLKHKELQSITINNDPAYPGKKMQYKAIPVSVLFKKIQIAENSVIQFKCTDGFSAPISKDRILNTNPMQSVAYIAIEEPSKPWPKLKGGKRTAGTFYMVWPNPEPSKISTEEWPFALSSLEVKGSLKSLYPKIFPDKKLKANLPINKGFRVFTKNCFACHKMNGDGAGKIGPDLNLPMNPTEYFKSEALKKLIRNPKKVRSWKLSLMPGFDPSVISDKELNHVIQYLNHMAKRKK